MPQEPCERLLVEVVTTRDIAWLAGLLEGEGSFHNTAGRARRGSTNQIIVQMSMADQDVIQKAARLFGGKPGMARTNVRPGHKPLHRIIWTGARAAGIMMTIYSFMGER